MKPRRWWVDRYRSSGRTRFLFFGDRIELAPCRRCLDVFTTRGSLLTIHFNRTAASYKTAQRLIRSGTGPARWTVNTRPLFIGIGGDNLVELGVGRWAWVATWLPDDLRLTALFRRPVTVPDVSK